MTTTQPDNQTTEERLTDIRATPFIDSQVIKLEVRDKVKGFNDWCHIVEVRENEVRIRRDGVFGCSFLINIDMLHIVIYRPDPIAKKSFYWLVKEVI